MSIELERTYHEKWPYSEDDAPAGPAYLDYDTEKGIYVVRFGDEVWFLNNYDFPPLPHPLDEPGNEVVIEDEFGDEFGGVCMELIFYNYNQMIIKLRGGGTDSDWSAQYGETPKGREQ